MDEEVVNVKATDAFLTYEFQTKTFLQRTNPVKQTNSLQTEIFKNEKKSLPLKEVDLLAIDLIHKWRSIYNSFVEVQISLPSLDTI